MWNKYKKGILTGIVVIIAFAVYTIFFLEDTVEEPLLIEEVSQQSTSVFGREINSALNQIESLNINREFFENPGFKSLVDRSEPLPEEGVGRHNPFAPLDDVQPIEGGGTIGGE